MMDPDKWFGPLAPAEREATPRRVPRGAVTIERLASGCILYRVDFRAIVAGERRNVRGRRARGLGDSSS